MSRCRPIDAGRRRAASRLVAAAVLGMGIALVGCAGSPPMRYHAISPVATPAKAVYEGLPIEIGAVQVPPALARQELVWESDGGQLQVREFDHWAAPLGRLARQALAEDLEARLPADKVVFPGAAWPAAGAVLTIDILSFSVRDGNAGMLLSWTLRPIPATGGDASAAAAAPRGAQLRLTTPADGGADAMSLAWSRLLGQLADQVTVELGRSPMR